MINQSTIMKVSWLNESSCQEKLKVLVGQTWRKISVENVFFYILIEAGLHRCTNLSTLSKCTNKTENAFDIKRKYCKQVLNSCHYAR